jgi:hypothetical protein
MEFIDENNVKGEMSDTDFKKEIEKEAEKRKDDMHRWGRDGNKEVFCERREYKGIPYLIKIIRYFQIGVPLDQIKGMNSLGKWAVLEYPEEVKPIADLLSTIEQTTGLYEFLYGDTLHSGQENWTLKQMVNQMDKQAHVDIDELFTLKEVITAKMNETIKRYEDVMRLISSFGNKESTWEVKKP